MNFTDLFIRRPVLSIVVSLLILLVGVKSFVSLPLRQFPFLTSTTISVTTAYPGAPADLMQGFITTPIEQAVSGVDGLDYLTSNSSQGVSTVTATLKLNRDPNAAMTDVMSKVQQVKFQIPREANDPIVLKSSGDQFVMLLAFVGSNMSGPAISDLVSRVIKPMLTTVDGVADVGVMGAQSLAMRIWLDPDKMAARGVTAGDVSTAIQNNNFQSAPGQAKGLFIVTNVTAETGLTDAESFKQLVVKSANGALVHMEDIARVEIGTQDYKTSASLNGKSAVILRVMPTPSGNPLTISQGVRDLEPEIKRSLPAGTDFMVGYDVSDFIRASIHEVIMTLIEAVAIVIVIIFLFLGTLRSVVIPVVTIPLSLLGAGAVMLAFGFSINLLTLLAMVLAIGLVVDDAIVVVENVYRHIEDGQTPLQAALSGAREIVGPVIAMTITLAAVYAPIGFLTGLTGSLFREFAFTLAGAVIISGITALTLSPMMTSVLLKQHMHDNAFGQAIDRVFVRVSDWYTARLTKVLQHRMAMAVFICGVFFSVAFFYVNSRSELAPAEDQGVVLSLIKGPQNANIDYTTLYAEKIGRLGPTIPEVDISVAFAGIQGVNSGFTAMRLKPWSQRHRSTADIQQDLQQQLSRIDGVNAFTFSPPPLPGATGNLPVSMVVYSPDDYQSVFSAMEKLKTAARESHLFISSDTDLTYNNPVFHINIDREKAHDLGLSMQSIGSTLATMVGENYVNRFNMQGHAYEVVTQVPRSLRLTPEALGQYYLRTASNEQIPLSTVVSISQAVEPNSLSRYNQLNSATFSAMPSPGVSMGQAVDFLNGQAKLLPKSFNTSFLSDTRRYVQEGNQLFYTFFFALVVIYLVLAAQFESLRDPLVILFSVPMSICGALLPLFFGISTVNIYTQVGLVTLIGLITKHGILMVAFARNMQRDHNADRRTAIIEAARVRLRPILMTTAAMVAGLLPLLFARGAGAGARFAIGLVVVSGMAVGTLFTLFVVPSVYLWIATDHRVAARSLRARPVPAE